MLAGIVLYFGLHYWNYVDILKEKVGKWHKILGTNKDIAIFFVNVITTEGLFAGCMSYLIEATHTALMKQTGRVF